MKMVLASHNQGKLKEFNAVFAPLSITLIPQAELQVGEIAETAQTFVENALVKARHAAEVTGLPALADDSGLVVDALHGAPGIYSARYAGIKASSADNIAKLLEDLKYTETAAFFYCVLVYLRFAQDPTPVIAEGRWYGRISPKARGSQGFGYDPIFFIPNLNQTAAELTLEQKNQISHRAIALNQLLKHFK